VDQDTTGTTAVATALTGKIGQDGPLGFLDVLTLGADVAEVLASRSGPHGDVRPAAVVEGPADGAWSLREPGAEGAPPGPVVAPELGAGEATAPGDVYALGAVLAYALTGHPFEPSAAPDGGDERAAPAGDGSADGGSGGDTGTPAEDRTLPEVMAAFLATLRSTLASDPAHRPAAIALAGSLRDLRVEAEQAMEGVAAGTGDTPTQVVMIAADGRLLNAQGQVIGTTRTDAKPTRQWIPMVVAAVALLVAVGVVVAYLRRPEQVAVAPTTTVASTTTTLPVTTTLPPETVPPSTLPAGLVAVNIDTSKSVSCRNCVVPLRALPSNSATATGQFPDKTELWARCFATGDNVNESGFNSNQWLLIAGPSGIQGWISTVWVGRQTWGLPACPPLATPAPTTTVAPTTVPTTAPPTTVPTTAAPTTTVAPTTVTTRPTTSLPD